MIEYLFQLESGKELRFEIDPERKPMLKQDGKPRARWTLLEYNQCEHCPLKLDECDYCPPAADLEGIIESFSDILSTEKALVTVKTENRECKKSCDVQTGLNSMLGLVMATSGCPHLSKLRNLANFHLPFSSYEETLFRTVGAYLLRQYFIFRDGGDPDLDLSGLDQMYKDLGILNKHFVERIQTATKEDSGANAVVIYWSLSSIVNASLEDQLDEEKSLFAPDL